MSHLTQVRGLKFFLNIFLGFHLLVAPYTGAWIEINVELLNSYDNKVAPYTGAWIEISFSITFPSASNVAPYTGAWIEIYSYNTSLLLSVSHLTQVRGLKSCYN